jgi:hypothetical protein
MAASPGPAPVTARRESDCPAVIFRERPNCSW